MYDFERKLFKCFYDLSEMRCEMHGSHCRDDIHVRSALVLYAVQLDVEAILITDGGYFIHRFWYNMSTEI